MRYTVDNPPQWLKGLPKAAIKIGLDVYSAVLDSSDKEDKARKAAWAAIYAKFEKSDGGWQAREAVAGTEQPGVIRFRADKAVDQTGLKWEVVLIVPGLSLNYPPFYWSEELLEASVDIFQGVDINAYELTADYFTHLPLPPGSADVVALEDVKRYLAAKKVGWVEKVWWEPGVGIKAVIRFLPDQDYISKLIQQGMEQGNGEVLGLSIDTRIKGVQVIIDGQTVIWPSRIVSCSSVDVVTRPAAGGKFIRALAGLKNNEGDDMKVDREKLLTLIEKNRPELLKGKDRAALSEDEILDLARMAMEPPKKDDNPEGGDPKDKDDPKRAAQDKDNPDPKTLEVESLRAALVAPLTAADMAKAVEAVEKRSACARTLDTEMARCGLPELAVKRIQGQFEGKIFSADDLTKAIKDEKEYLAQMHAQGFDLDEQTRFSGGLGEKDKVQVAVDRAFGLTAEDYKTLGAVTRTDGRPVFEDLRAAQDVKDVPAIGGLGELYVLLTGDSEVNGRFSRQGLPAGLRAAQDINSGTFSYVMGNTLSRRLVKDYLGSDYREDLLISIAKSVKDFKTQEAVNVGYFPDLADVDPEAADYAEIAGVNDEESTYSIGTKGNLLTITRKTIINDDLSLVQRLVARLGRAARRTHAKYVWDKYVSNAICSDGTAWFTSGHGNLGTTALSFAAALAAYQALAKMTEKDSGERIGLLDDPSVKPILVYPVDLLATAESIIGDDHYYATNDLTDKTRNPMKGKITGAQISLLTDANDWGMLLPASLVDMVEMGYLNGRKEPEMFLADSPTAEQVFVADKIRYKIRHEYAGAVIARESGFKAVVA